MGCVEEALERMGRRWRVCGRDGSRRWKAVGEAVGGAVGGAVGAGADGMGRGLESVGRGAREARRDVGEDAWRGAEGAMEARLGEM